jgi:flagellar biosynthesis/type III secretory pathway protein FliH
MRQAMLKLEVFETAPDESETVVLDAKQAEKLRETAFEQGYAAGWQDALEYMRNEDAMRRIAAEEALQRISFTYTEAHAGLQGSFLALTEAMLARVLPEAVRLALPACLRDELVELVAQNTLLPVRLRCAPDACATLEPVLASLPDLPVELVPEPSFTDAQVALTLGAQERMIDLDGLLARMREIFAEAVQRQSDKETAHG